MNKGDFDYKKILIESLGAKTIGGKRVVRKKQDIDDLLSKEEEDDTRNAFMSDKIHVKGNG